MVEILSLGIPGIIEMYVWIDTTGQHEQTLCIDSLVSCPTFFLGKIGANFCNHPIIDSNIDLLKILSMGKGDFSAFDNQLCSTSISFFHTFSGVMGSLYNLTPTAS